MNFYNRLAINLWNHANKFWVKLGKTLVHGTKKSCEGLGEWVSSFLTAHLHKLGCSGRGSVQLLAVLLSSRAKSALLMSIFLLAVSPRPPRLSSPHLPGMWQIDCSRKVKLWFLNSFGCGGVSKKVTFALDLALQNATWRQNGFTYRKNELCDFARAHILSIAENYAKICQETAEILWCICAFGAFLSTESLCSQHCHRALLTV